jgi:hypothetical protein
MLRGLGSYYVDGVCEGVHASHVLIKLIVIVTICKAPD